MHRTLPGPGFARNEGVGHAGGDLIVFCDADDVVAEGWLQALVTEATREDIVGGAVSLQPAEALPRIMGFLPHASGGSIAVWREVFEGLGGFNPMFIVGEDVEFSWRAQLAGFRIGYTREARIWRRPRPNGRSAARQMFRYGYWGALLYREYSEHGVPRTSIRHLARRLGWLTVRLPYLFMAERRRVWIRQTSYGVGTIAGSWKHKVWYTP